MTDIANDATENVAGLIDIDVESIINEINGSISDPVDAVTADVEAILAEISDNPAATIEAAPAEKPKRTRTKKSKDPSATAPADGATGAAPTTAPVAVNSGAFLALTKLDASAYQLRFDAAAKKVKEKASNALAAIDSGKKLSRFTGLAVKALVDKRAVTSGDLIQVYRDAGLGAGTARAQGQQMTALFRMLDLVEQDGKTFKLANDELGKQLVAAAA